MVSASLNQIMSRLSFLSQYPIRMVTSIKIARGTRRVLLETSKLVGDHPAHPQESLEYRESLPTEDLYIQILPDYWIPLYPYVTSKTCNSCGNREVYFIDKWNPRNKVISIKSFDQGHSEDTTDPEMVRIFT